MAVSTLAVRVEAIAMTTRRHVHEEIFDVDPATLFTLLHTPSAIRQWWGASHVIVDPKPGGVWVGLWGEEDSPDFITAGRMSVFDPPKADRVFRLRVFRAQRTAAFCGGAYQ